MGARDLGMLAIVPRSDTKRPDWLGCSPHPSLAGARLRTSLRRTTIRPSVVCAVDQGWSDPRSAIPAHNPLTAAIIGAPRTAGTLQ